MANLTENYSLIKPLQTETYDVDVFNTNCDTLDALIKSLEQKFMPQVGDVIITLDGTNPETRYADTVWSLADEGLYIKTAGKGITAGSTGGTSSVTLKTENIPEHNHPISMTKAGGHVHSGTTSNADLSGNFRSRSNMFYDTGKGQSGTLGTGSANGRFSVQESGLRSEGNADNNHTEYIVHFNGNHNHELTTQNSGDHIHTIQIGNTGGGKPFTVTPPYKAFYFWVRTK